MTKQSTKQTVPNEKTQEEIYINLTRMLNRMDVASNSYTLSTVAMQCDEKVQFSLYSRHLLYDCSRHIEICLQQ